MEDYKRIVKQVIESVRETVVDIRGHLDYKDFIDVIVVSVVQMVNKVPPSPEMIAEAIHNRAIQSIIFSFLLRKHDVITTKEMVDCVNKILNTIKEVEDDERRKKG